MGHITPDRFAGLSRRSSILVAGLLLYPLLDGTLEDKNERIGAAQTLALIQRGHVRFAGTADQPLLARAESPPDDRLRPEEQLMIDELFPTSAPVPFPQYAPILTRLTPLVWEQARTEGLLRWRQQTHLAVIFLLTLVLPMVAIAGFAAAVILLWPLMAQPWAATLLAFGCLAVAGVFRSYLRLSHLRIGRTRAGNDLIKDLLELRDDLRALTDARGNPSIEAAAQGLLQPYAIMLGAGRGPRPLFSRAP